MVGIGKGSYLVIYKKTIGNTNELDVVIVTNGVGISSKPWIVTSLLTKESYQVCAMDIDKDSYHSHLTRKDAETIYIRLAGKSPIAEPRTSQELSGPMPF